MISQATLHAITDRIGKQADNIRTTNGVYVTSVTGTADTVCESLYNIFADELISDGDKAGTDALSPILDSLQTSLDTDTILVGYYTGLVRALENHIATTGSTYNGFEDFAFATSGTRYASSFLRVAALMGYTFATPAMGFYSAADVLGAYAATGAGTGTWTKSNFAWTAADVVTYGVQPCGQFEIVADGAINVADDITITAQAVEAVTGSIVTLTATLSAGDPDGTTATMTGPFLADYVKEILNVSSTDGTAADAVNIRFKSLRTLSLD